ncbi:uncharacterized protein LOC135196975 isoform X2 [Macrobrachium nipponense]|uniref:uncharacterized protein LOC135196975 isoform X2 n=1 Tax=Macrobrachium nipponense TaxID=159736 RepID=UPI0030C8A2D0
MSANRSVGGLDDIDHLCLKVVKIVKSEARIVLYCIWNWGCERDLTVPFEDHAINVLKWDIIKYKKKFDNTMQTKIRNNPKGDEFDVTLLYACISSTCTRFSGSDMKTIIRPIAFFRNDVMHDDIVKDEASMNDAIAKIRQMLVDALNKAKEVYLVPENEIDGMIQRMDETIKEIKESPVPLHDIEDYRVKVKEHRKALEKLVEEKGVSCLKTTFKMLSNVDPASWISGKERLNIEMVYIRLEMKWKPNSDSSSYEPIGHESLLCQTYEDGIVPKIIVIQGEAGSGKSTLTKFILADWAKNSPSIIGLQEYDLILYVECKNRYISNFIDLLTSLMPQVSYEMTDTDFRRSVLEKKTLIIVDGLDEMNENSEKLLIEMLEIYQNRKDNRFQFIMTTRPQEIKIKKTLLNKFPTVHIKIHGVPAERRVEFVQKLHDEMVKEGLSKEDTSKLVDYMKHSECRLQEHYRLPLNLTLLTYLWANDSKAVNSVTSATQLYVAVLNLLKGRVVFRIPHVSSNSIQVSMDTLLNRIFQVSLETHKRNSLELSAECYKKLEDECEELNLPSVEILGAFFAVHDDYSVYCGPNKYNLFVPHKSIMEFFAANHIYSCLVENRADRCKEKLKAIEEEFPGIFKYQLVNEQPKTLRGVLETLLNDGKDLNPSILPHYQNTLIHLSGLLALQDKEALHKYGIELVDILEESEIKDSQWLDLLAEADCDSLLSTSIAEHISGLVIEDGHTLAAIQLFKDLDSKTPVRVILQDEVKYIPQLDTLMEKLAERDCAVELLLNNHWKNPDNGLSTTYLEKLVNNSNCRVTRFTGNLDNIEMLPKDLEDVRLTISCNKQAELICKGIAELDKELHLSYIGIHVMKGVSPSFLKPLPVVKPNQKESGTIWLSDISDDDVSIACSLIKALHPPGMMFHSIMFPRCQLSLNGFECLLNELEQQQVKISKNIKSDSQVLGINEVPTLSKLTKKLFGRPFQRDDGWST